MIFQDDDYGDGDVDDDDDHHHDDHNDELMP